jgi:hypothetical protein
VLRVREEVRLHLQAGSVHYVGTVRNDEESLGLIRSVWRRQHALCQLPGPTIHACAGLPARLSMYVPAGLPNTAMHEAVGLPAYTHVL